MADPVDPPRPPSRPVVIVIEVDQRLPLEDVSAGIIHLTELFQRVTCWGSPKAFFQDPDNEYLKLKDEDPFVTWQPTGLYH